MNNENTDHNIQNNITDDDEISQEIINTHKDINEDNLEQDIKPKKKRRTKKTEQHLLFICEICEKGYLSEPALRFHKRKKHGINDKEGKYRVNIPKQYSLCLNSVEDNFALFFNTPERMPSLSITTSEMTQIVKDIFDIVFVKKILPFEVKKYKNIQSNTFFNRIINEEMLNIEDIVSLDDAYVSYINYVKEQTNLATLRFILLILTIVREVFNKTKKRKESSATKAVCKVSKNLNQIVLECQAIYDESLDVAINLINYVEVILHFAYWLNVNGLSKYKVTLADLTESSNLNESNM